MDFSELSTKWNKLEKDLCKAFPSKKQGNAEKQFLWYVTCTITELDKLIKACEDLEKVLSGPMKKMLVLTSVAERTTQAIAKYLEVLKEADLAPYEPGKDLAAELDKELDQFVKGFKSVKTMLGKFQKAL
jgi:hypothetical protein